ncbi:hypothetical protein ACA910_011366 [Epithemia clementina (nom. ined.)]
MYQRSGWTPPPWTIPKEIHDRTDNFCATVKALFRKRYGTSNLLPHQRRTLRELQRRDDLLVVSCDKNLGPAVIEYSAYVNKAFQDHLSDASTYKSLTRHDAENVALNLRYKLQFWIVDNKMVLSKVERRFLRHNLAQNTTPFPVFYFTMKVHKHPWTTRPIVSCSGSLTHPLGIWVDSKLQAVARAQPSFFASSAELKLKLEALGQLPPGAKLFTADAVSMYTNIKTMEALHEIGRYLRGNQEEFPKLPVNALMSALRLVMQSNVFQFGDTYWHQQTGTAMGTPPAPPYATIFFAIHENRSIILNFLDNLHFY